MKNVTITLNEKVARWARIKAAEQEKSLSRLVGDLLQEKMHEEEKYLLSMQKYLARSPQILKKRQDPYPRREDLYGR